MESRTQIEETAARWVARRDRKDLSQADEQELAAWLQASIAHRVAFIRLDSMWREANRLKALGAGVGAGVVPAPGEWQRSPFLGKKVPQGRPVTVQTASGKPRNRPVVRLRVLAASVLVGAIAVGTAWMMKSAGPAYQTHVGSIEGVTLADGSRVLLNTDSKIRVEISATERRIQLNRGEAFFDVAKEPTRPFVVVAGEQRVVAVGTKFSVRRFEHRSDEVQVVVTEGRVRMEPPTSAVKLPPVTVAAGNIARGSGAGVLLDAEPERPVDEYLTWRTGFLMFRATPLAEAAAEFNRYNATKIVIDDAAVGAVRIGGNFRSDNVEVFVRLVERSFPVRVERHGERIVLTAN
jgi:transmembrane sensor